MLAQGQIVMMGLDVQDSAESTNIYMTMFWFVVMMTSLFWICTFLPMGLFYAESDEGKAFVSRLILDDTSGRAIVSALHLGAKLLYGV